MVNLLHKLKSYIEKHADFVDTDYIEELIEKDKLNEALIIVNQTLRKFPNNTAAWSFKGDILLDLERYAEAEFAYAKSLKMEPKNEEV